MQLLIVIVIPLWFIQLSEQSTIPRRQYPHQIQFASITEQSDYLTDESTQRSKRLSDNLSTSSTYRNPFAAFLKRKRHSKSTDSRLSIRKEFTGGDSKCGLMCHLLCRPGCSKICYSSCT
ncbi:hypothetical protein MN116_002601 [Schistosoma mekongi]|uniref:Uncharacterized protein n=1 Tax=Schistosoma mekongi TaxID=38744 RepID=A0AAE1ZH66_SCHME|nr:hypothetical protein MN116_002601 [Schistosoma mekongi]